MSGIPREQLLKELLPGMQELFGLEMEAQEVARVKKSIGKGDEPFIPRDVYQRVIADYEKKLERQAEQERGKVEAARQRGKKVGTQLAGQLVESMAKELGDSNLLTAVAMAIYNMDIPE